jgi:hypothetical protein
VECAGDLRHYRSAIALEHLADKSGLLSKARSGDVIIAHYWLLRGIF